MAYLFSGKVEMRAKAMEVLSGQSRGRDQVFLGRSKVELTDHNTFELGLEG